MATNLFETAAGRDKVLRRFSVFDSAGHDLRGCDTLETALETAGINYGGELQSVYLQDGTEIPNNYCVTKSTDGTPLGIVGKSYRPVANMEAFGVAGELVDNHGFKFEVGGASIGARNITDYAKTFMVLRGEDIRIGKDDGELFNTFVVFRNSFDGSSGIQYRVVMQRLVCLNGMTRYLGGKKSQLWINIQHSESANSRIEIANQAIRNYSAEIAAIRAEAIAFIETPFTRAEFEREIVPTLLKSMKFNIEDDSAANMQKMQRVVQMLLSAYDAEDTANYNSTAYKVILAMTDFESHYEPMRNTNNPSLYMDRTLSGMMLTTAIATYIAQTRNVMLRMGQVR